MTTYIALLRSVNVAGQGRMPMSEVTQSFVTLGYRDVRTYIQTGNVLFASPSKSETKLVEAIERRLDLDFGTSPAVLLRTATELARVVATSPYLSQAAEPSRHHVTFLRTTPTAERLAAFTAPPSGNDELTIIGREIYVHTPDGYANTKLNGAYLERHLGVVSTTRNWNSVAKLCQLAAE